MLKFICVFILALNVCEGRLIRTCSWEVAPNVELVSAAKYDFMSKWGPDIRDFLELLDLEKVLAVFMQHLTDPEVLKFINFLLSPEFKDIVWDLETMAEFKEAYAFLASKGYDVEAVMKFINSGLNLPEFEKSKLLLRNGGGLSGLLEDLIAILPVKDIQNLFENKLENNPELAEIFDTINSEEFVDILRRMSRNPELAKIRDVFEGYGFDFTYVCSFAKTFFGKYYQGIFCE